MAYKHGYPVINVSWYFRAVSFVVFYILCFPIAIIICRFVYAVRYEDRKTLLNFKGNAILVSNHTTMLDPVMVCGTAFPHFIFHTLLEKTVATPFLGTFVRFLGGIPLLTGAAGLEKTVEASKILFKTHRYLHFYPEGECYLYNQHIMPFKSGAFYIAARLNIPVIPIVTVFSNIKKMPFQKYPSALLVVLNPVLPEQFIRYTSSGSLKMDSVKELAHTIRLAMQAKIDSYRLRDNRYGTQSYYKGKMPRMRGVNA